MVNLFDNKLDMKIFALNIRLIGGFIIYKISNNYPYMIKEKRY